MKRNYGWGLSNGPLVYTHAFYVIVRVSNQLYSFNGRVYKLLTFSVYWIVFQNRGRRPCSYITHNNSVCEYGLHSFVPACSAFTLSYNWPLSPPNIVVYHFYLLLCVIGSGGIRRKSVAVGDWLWEIVACHLQTL